MAYCEKCKYENVCEMPAFIRNDVKRCKVFEERKPQKPQTNADRIRSMSDEELAEFLVNFKNTFGEEYEGGMSCLDWLQSEAE